MLEIEPGDEYKEHRISFTQNANAGIYITCDTNENSNHNKHEEENMTNISFTPIPGISRYYVGISNSPNNQIIGLSINDPRLTPPQISPDLADPLSVTAGDLITVTKLITNTGSGTNFSVSLESPSDNVIPISTVITATINPGEGKPFDIPVRIQSGAGTGNVELRHTAYHEGGKVDAGITTITINEVTHRIYLPLVYRAEPQSNPLREIEEAVIIIGNRNPDPLVPSMDAIASVFFESLVHLGLNNPNDIHVFSHNPVDLNNDGRQDDDYPIINDQQVLNKIRQILNGMESDKTLAIMYVGHGIGSSAGDSRMLISGNYVGGEDYRISGEELFTVIFTDPDPDSDPETNNQVKVLIINEMCHAGSLSIDALRLLSGNQLNNLVIISSSEPDELSWVNTRPDIFSATTMWMRAFMNGLSPSQAINPFQKSNNLMTTMIIAK